MLCLYHTSRGRMKRKIQVKAGRVRITATINTDGRDLTRREVERVRDALADRLQDAASDLLYIGVPRNRVQVQ